MYFWKKNSLTVNSIKIFWSFHIKVWIICTIILKEILSNNVNVIVNALILDHRKEKYKKVKTKIFCKVLYRYANNPVAAKKLFFRPHRRRQCWFLFFNFFFCKNPSFIYAKNILTTKSNRNAFGFFKTCHQGLQVLILILGKYKRSWRFSHNSLDDFIFLKNYLHLL